MYANLLVFLLFLFLSMGQSSASMAESYLVTVKQLNVKEEASSEVCVDDKKCYIQLKLISPHGKTAPLIVETLFMPGNVIFKFRTGNQYFYASEFKSASTPWWHIPLGDDKYVEKNINLFLPTVSETEVNNLHQIPLNKNVSRMISQLDLRIESLKN